MDKVQEMRLRHQKLMLAVRSEMGWPKFRPANNSVCFGSGLPVDLGIAAELARLSQKMQMDIVYSGWSNPTAKRSAGLTIVYRDVLAVDVISKAIPWAADMHAPLMFLNGRADEHFAVDGRGSLTRLPGKPRGIARGHQLAMKRIKTTAASMSNELNEHNQLVRTGTDWIDTHPPLAPVMRFN